MYLSLDHLHKSLFKSLCMYVCMHGWMVVWTILYIPMRIMQLINMITLDWVIFDTFGLKDEKLILNPFI